MFDYQLERKSINDLIDYIRETITVKNAIHPKRGPSLMESTTGPEEEVGIDRCS